MHTPGSGDSSGARIKELTSTYDTALLKSLVSSRRVQGLTHAFYRYPARFSPEFARYVIKSFSNPGDAVLDPFMGGGTTVVEALTLGRRVMGLDLNPIAVFIAKAKTMPLSGFELETIRHFVQSLCSRPLRLHGKQAKLRSDSYYRNVPWWIRNCILALQREVARVGNPRGKAFLKCGLLKTAQWALDCKEIIPGSRQFVDTYCQNILLMSDQMAEYRARLQRTGIRTDRDLSRYRHVVLSSATEISGGIVPPNWPPFKLVVTSPPYPGVHVLYHRWQVRGRKETPVPFAIINGLDGNSPSFYTFGGRNRNEAYFERLYSAFLSISRILTDDSLVVQLVSFANPQRDVGRFLDTMEMAGFEEYYLGASGFGERLWRLIPNRKWYHRYKNGLQPGKELVIFHRLKR